MTASNLSLGQDARGRLVHVIQGEFAISADPDVVLSTVLGSCVSACLFDRQAGIGGMNHFLLPQSAGRDSDMNHAAAAMERLLNALLKAGAVKSRVVAKLFGGARMMSGLPDIGHRNGLAAGDFLRLEGIGCEAQSLGGDRARRLRFVPTTGRVQMMLLPRDTMDPAQTPSPTPLIRNDAELF